MIKCEIIDFKSNYIVLVNVYTGEIAKVTRVQLLTTVALKKVTVVNLKVYNNRAVVTIDNKERSLFYSGLSLDIREKLAKNKRKYTRKNTTKQVKYNSKNNEKRVIPQSESAKLREQKQEEILRQLNKLRIIQSSPLYMEERRRKIEEAENEKKRQAELRREERERLKKATKYGVLAEGHAVLNPKVNTKAPKIDKDDY